jgi:hypothetical protein
MGERMRGMISVGALSAFGAAGALVAGVLLPATAVAVAGVASPVETHMRVTVQAVAPASLSRCQARARQARTTCIPGPVVAGNRCTLQQSGWFSLTQTRTVVTCKRSWGTVYTWVWA